MQEERTLHRRKEAELTGREYSSVADFLLECLCPHCQGPQWHSPGAAECIYCGSSMNVSHLKIISRTMAPPEESRAIPGPDVVA